MLLTPYIYLVGVVAASENQLRSSVVPGDYVGRVQPISIKDLRGTKVAYFNDTVFCKKYVFRLEVTVAYFLFVNIAHPIYYLPHVFPHSVYRYVLLFLFMVLDNFF